MEPSSKAKNLRGAEPASSVKGMLLALVEEPKEKN